MVFEFAAATVAGFLLTAIPNWTGRMPLQGGPSFFRTNTKKVVRSNVILLVTTAGGFKVRIWTGTY